MEPTDFEKWCAGEMGRSVGFVMSFREHQGDSLTYENIGMEIRYRAYMAGVRSRLPYQTQPPEE